jgi:FkbM family methyltransferase
MKQIASLSYSFRRLWPTLPFHGLTVPMQGEHVSKPIWKHVWRGDYEWPELRALSALLRPEDRVLELGLGMGLVSGVLAHRLPSARFTSYEANPALLPHIAALHKANGIGNVAVRSAIVAPLSKGAVRKFRLHRHFTESSLTAASAELAEVEVPVHDPETVISELRPDILICDIEGAEEELIPHLPLSGLRGAVIELHPQIVPRAGIARIFRTFLEAGLVPVVEQSFETVVAFERVPQ